jgi:3-oxoacyl-[acyl-carrier-protein] synthase II
MDRYAQYAMVSSEEAVNDAGLISKKLDKDRAEGVIWGSGIGGLETFQIEMLILLLEMEHQNLILSLSKMISDIACGHFYKIWF